MRRKMMWVILVLVVVSAAGIVLGSKMAEDAAQADAATQREAAQ